MKIETKYNIGDEVWVYLDEECIKGRIFNIRIYVKQNNSVDCWYNVMIDDDDICLPSNYLFPSKEELLRSL